MYRLECASARQTTKYRAWVMHFTFRSESPVLDQDQEKGGHQRQSFLGQMPYPTGQIALDFLLFLKTKFRFGIIINRGSATGSRTYICLSPPPPTEFLNPLVTVRFLSIKGDDTAKLCYLSSPPAANK